MWSDGTGELVDVPAAQNGELNSSVDHSEEIDPPRG